MADDFIWLHHAETGGHFRCPAAAVDDMAQLGWQLADGPPEEINPAVAEQLAWRQELAAQAAQPKPTTKTAARGDQKEMSDDG